LVAGRLLAETLVASVSCVILIVILGLRYVNGSFSGTSTPNNPFLNAVTSTLFLTLVPVSVLVGIAVVEAIYRRKSSTELRDE